MMTVAVTNVENSKAHRRSSMTTLSGMTIAGERPIPEGERWLITGQDTVDARRRLSDSPTRTVSVSAVVSVSK